MSRLDDMLQAAVGWTESHVHTFAVGDVRCAMCFDDEGVHVETSTNADYILRHGLMVVDDPSQVGLRSSPGQGVVGNVEGHLLGRRAAVMRQRELHDEFGLDSAAAR